MAITGPVEVVTYASSSDETATGGGSILVQANVAAGETMFCMFSYEVESGSTTHTFAVSDSEGNSWDAVIVAVGGANSRDNVYLARCYVTNALTSGVSTITVLATTAIGAPNGVFALVVEKFAGVADAAAEVTSTGSDSTTSSPTSGAPGTPTSTDVLYVGLLAVFRFTTATFTAAAGWNSFTTVSEASTAGAKVAIYPRYQIVADGSSKTLSGTLSASKADMAVVAGFGAEVASSAVGRDLTLLGAGA